MKKVGLIMFGCFVLATNTMAVNWPAGYVFIAGSGCEFATPPDDFPGDDYLRATVRAQPTSFDLGLPEDATAFDNEWTRLHGDYGYGEEHGIDKACSDNSAPPNETPAKFKVAYDEAIYVFVTYKAPAASDMGCELMFCPYDKLQNAPTPPIVPNGNMDMSYVCWMRYLELGGFRLDATPKNDGKFTINGLMGCINGSSGFNSYRLKGTNGVVYMNDCSSSEVVKLAFRIDFFALHDVSNDVEFSHDVWYEACNGKGISFDIKFVKGAGCEYMWNATSNNVYFNNAYAGYLEAGFCIDPPIGVDDIAANALNLSVAGDLIKLAEAGNVQIFNAAGIPIASANNVTEVSTSSLATGIYIAVSGKESVSFVK